MTRLTAYLLVAHGSRDARPQIALERLAYLVQQHLGRINNNESSNYSPGTLFKNEIEPTITKTATITKKTSSYWVETAALELAPYSLHERIEEMAKRVQQAGGNLIKIMPLFLLPGVHVKEDIPAEIALASSKESAVKLELCPYLGSQPQITGLLAAQFEQFSSGGRILLSHGSRRPGANQIIEQIAGQLSAKAAYWSVSPSLSEQIEALKKSGCQSITILPYFLFRGGITDAIAQQVNSLQQTHQTLKLLLGEPLGATPELANLIINS